MLIPMLFVMFSKSGQRYVLPLMWGLLVLDLLIGSFLFALIQGGLLAWYYHQRRQLARGPGPADPGQPPAARKGRVRVARPSSRVPHRSPGITV